MKDYKGVRPCGDSIQIDFRDIDGKRQRVTWPLKPIAANLEAANLKRQAIVKQVKLARLGLGKFDIAEHFPNCAQAKKSAVDDDATVEAIFTGWYEKNKSDWSFLHAEKTFRMMNFFIEYFGAKKPINSITTAAIEEWVDSRKKAVISMKRIRNQLIVVRGALDFWCKKRRLDGEKNVHHPMMDLESIKPTKDQLIKKRLSDEEIDPFDIAEVKAILQAITSETMRNLVQFCIWTGLRPNEWFALAWEDVDFIHGKVHIKFGMTSDHITPLKTGASQRTIDLNELPGAYEALRRQKAHTYMMDPVNIGKYLDEIVKKGAGISLDRRPIFRNPTNGGMFTQTQQFSARVWPRILRRAGVRHRYPYQMRHTFASIMLSLGKTPSWIANVMGHKDTMMVIKNYGKYIEDASKLMNGNSADPRVTRLMEEIAC